jgi:hypothetical protein
MHRRLAKSYGAKLHILFASQRFLWHEWCMGRLCRASHTGLHHISCQRRPQCSIIHEGLKPDQPFQGYAAGEAQPARRNILTLLLETKMTYDKMTDALTLFNAACIAMEKVDLELFAQLTPDGAATVHESMECLGRAFSNLLADKDEGEYLNTFSHHVSEELIGQLILQLPLTIMGDDDKLDKRLAIDVAETLGPDHAQTLYKFAVLVTKLA